MLNKKGETITETLISVVIVAIAFIALQTSIIAAGRVNKKANGLIRNFDIRQNATNTNWHLSIKHNDGSVSGNVVTIKKSSGEDGYYFY